ncbi:CHAD domain-containing protein [Cribrihabitans neustonicus]|uniref:CHAD domain-containing protein n=1 Tax=Cribrihabitans neustonicus TaxID=1429085 RepID=UPI003B5BD365
MQLLDSFCGTLRESGRLLLQSGGRLCLFGPRGRLSQPGAGGLVSGLPGGPVQRVLKKLCPLRRLLPVAEGRLTRFWFRPARRDKPRGELMVFGLETPLGTASLICSKLSGGKTLRALERHLEALGAAPGEPAALYALLAPEQPHGHAKPMLRLMPDLPARQAAGQIFAAHLAAARQNELGIISDLDTEFLHDYRIALRRSRALLSGMKGVLGAGAAVRLRRDLSALMSRTGRLRDLDVFLLEQDRIRARLPAALHPALAALFAAISAERAACQQTVARHLCGASYHWHMAGLTAEAACASATARLQDPGAAQPIGPLARKLIRKRHAKLCGQARQITDRSPDEDIHALRIGCKKLRYQLELFAPLFPEEALAQALKPLRRLQNRLGRFNDCAQQETVLLEFAARGFAAPGGDPNPAGVKAALAAGALVALLHQEQRATRARLGKRLKAFASPAAQARFQALCRRG